jgi:GNAT superfamily N-acetyltransferase
MRRGAFTLRRGEGGGQRVSAATVEGPWTAGELLGAEAAMRAMGQAPLFMLTPQDAALDLALAARGFQIKDQVVVFAGSCAMLAADGPAHMTTFPHWPPLEIAKSLWLDGHVGPARLAIMARAAGPRAVLLGRANDRAAGVAFVALSGGTAFVHALHVVPGLRRQGLARNLMRAAAAWGKGAGADQLALAVTAANAPAVALYASMEMAAMGQYHYRVLAE